MPLLKIALQDSDVAVRLAAAGSLLQQLRRSTPSPKVRQPKDNVMWKFIAVLILTAAIVRSRILLRPTSRRHAATNGLETCNIRSKTRRAISSTPRWESRETCAGGRDCSTPSHGWCRRSQNCSIKTIGEAAKQLGEAAEQLDNATKGAKQDESILAMRSLTGTLREVRLDLSMGKPVSIKKLDEIQREIDRQLNK